MPTAMLPARVLSATYARFWSCKRLSWRNHTDSWTRLIYCNGLAISNTVLPVAYYVRCNWYQKNAKTACREESNLVMIVLGCAFLVWWPIERVMFCLAHQYVRNSTQWYSNPRVLCTWMLFKRHWWVGKSIIGPGTRPWMKSSPPLAWQKPGWGSGRRIC